MTTDKGARIAELAAENERLRRLVMAQSRAIHSPESLSRTGGVKVDRQRLNMEISKWATDSDLHITIGDVEALHLAILPALEPAAPEGRQEAMRIGDAALEWMVKFDLLDGGNEYYVADVLAVLNDLTPSTRPSEQTVTEALRDLLEHVDRNTCIHEETHRGGSIWTICNSCGQKWADDRGGFAPYSDPKPVANARSALKAAMEAGR